MPLPPPPASTSQEVPPGYQPYSTGVTYSSWGNRIGAYLARALPSAIVWVPLWILMSTMTASSSDGVLDGSVAEPAEGPGVITLLVLLAAYVFILAVQIRMMIQRGRLGYDFGDAVAGQRLVRDGSLQPLGSGWNVFWRGLVHIVDALPCYAGFFAPLWTSKKQTFADSIMKTVVVKSQSSHQSRDLLVNALKVWAPVIKH